MTKRNGMKDHFFSVVLMAVVDLLAVLLLGFLFVRPVKEAAGALMSGMEPIENREQVIAGMVRLQADLDAMREEKALAQKRASQLHASEIEQPAVGACMGRIAVPGAGIDLPLYFGDTPAILNQGVGTYAGSALPGFAGLTLVCSHNGASQLGPLGQAQAGDLIEVEMPYGDYTYRIDEIKVVDAGDSTAYDFTVTEDQLILYTCYPLYYSAPTNDRLFVYCTRISGKAVITD